MLFLVGTAAGPGFAVAEDASPRDFPGCVLWLRADDGVVTDDAGHVSKWRDKSGAGHDLDRVEGEGPSRKIGLNGKPVMRFDGLGTLGGSHDFSESLSAHTLLLVARWTDDSPENCQRIFFSPDWNWAFGYQGGDDQTWLGGGIWIYSKDGNIYGPGSINTNWHVHTTRLKRGQEPNRASLSTTRHP